MNFLRNIAEARIREAIERGELDDLPLRGKPIRVEDLSRVPDDLRVGFMVLKRAGVLPEEMQLQKEIVTLADLIRACEDDGQRERLRKRMNERQLQFRILMERRKRSAAFHRYGGKIRRRLGA